MLRAAFATFLLVMGGAAAQAQPTDWSEIASAARGDTVYFHGWGGSPSINAYIDWAAERLARDHDITLVRVGVGDIAESVGRVLAEKTAGRETGGAVDLIWINGENFAAMVSEGLLRGEPWALSLPNARFLDPDNRVLTEDFTVSVEGRESPWGLAQLTFYHDEAILPEPPRTLEDLAAWIGDNPGRFTYAAPPDFIGTTFLKQLALGLLPAETDFAAPPPDDADAVLAPLWAWLDGVHPDLWRSGRVFASGVTQIKTLLADDEIDIAMTFNPGEASSAIAEGLLPASVRSFVLDYGSIGNAHFLAIPVNASAPEAAMVVADFLLSPEAQARKADETVWGDPTVLDIGRLDADGRALFDALETGPATLAPEARGALLPEPHPAWTEAIERGWLARYGAGG
ncbi:ABC transporter substrate-binding protein [Arsenicitalea aurantiaca]|uniref:ABC transporter substrate-binding protein n=1 Tax=Arsenicitalea aurantiaca TaxID=1783274 RepID=A0A433X3X2_9HYPH|nr:ABC transporter substrate-binding protein [Arsenicitalea aurantiaca]RUT28764.1 ABC transporter substrate-binding protein [Arsenicitalea aurantiaca]